MNDTFELLTVEFDGVKDSDIAALRAQLVQAVSRVRTVRIETGAGDGQSMAGDQSMIAIALAAPAVVEFVKAINVCVKAWIDSRRTVVNVKIKRADGSSIDLSSGPAGESSPTKP